ncbi:MAG: DUF4177 domain-containing protein [Opitutales bacterium]|nr:DUF4177 domain-containing protein [Opitutales bacterium]
MKEYKIISQEDDTTYQRLNKEELENKLNSNSKDGWRLHSVSCGQVTGGSRHNEYVIFLERDRD